MLRRLIGFLLFAAIALTGCQRRLQLEVWADECDDPRTVLTREENEQRMKWTG